MDPKEQTGDEPEDTYVEPRRLTIQIGEVSVDLSGTVEEIEHLLERRDISHVIEYGCMALASRQQRESSPAPTESER